MSRSPQRENTIASLENVEVHFEQDAGLVDRFFSEKEIVRAVDGVDLEIVENQIVALVGESDCGKTTLGKTVVGAQRPTGGSVKYRGQDIWEAKESRKTDVSFADIRKSLQMIHQDPGSSLNPSRNVHKSLADPLKRRGVVDAGKREAAIVGMLETVGMTPPEDYANRFPHQLSGGEQQRVALIRALVMNPDLILADEAISALDVSLRIEMMDLFLELQSRFNTSFLFISHDLANAWYLTRKSDGVIGIMYLGRLVEIGSPEQIFHDPQHPYTKALIWATPELYADDADVEMPLRGIDVPDPVNLPSGCRFHTRCPKAREVCLNRSPEQIEAEDGHLAACYRADDDHEYWDSEPVPTPRRTRRNQAREALSDGYDRERQYCWLSSSRSRGPTPLRGSNESQ